MYQLSTFLTSYLSKHNSKCCNVFLDLNEKTLVSFVAPVIQRYKTNPASSYRRPYELEKMRKHLKIV